MKENLGPQLYTFLIELSKCVPLIEGRQPPFEKYSGYVSGWRFFCDHTLPSYPGLERMLDSDPKFQSDLKNFFDEGDLSYFFRKNIAETNRIALSGLVTFLADSSTQERTVTRPAIKRQLSEKPAPRVYLETISRVESILVDSIRGAPEALTNVASMSRDEETWIAFEVASNVSFFVLISLSSEGLIQFAYYFQQSNYDFLVFTLSGLPTALSLLHSDHLDIEKIPELQNLFAFIEFLSSIEMG